MRVIYIFSALIIGVLFLGASSGAANIQGKDRTGGPLSDGFCGNCHAVGAFNPALNVKVFQNGSEVTTYEAGMQYTLRISVSADAGAQVYGFQAVALTGTDDSQAGTFTAGTGQQVVTLSDRDYVEHSMRSESNTFDVQWTAPMNSSGDVRFYAAAVAANNAAGSGGDGAVFLTSPVVLNDATVNTNDLPAFAASLNAFPNPVQDQLNLSFNLNESKEGEINLFNALGQKLICDQYFLTEGENNISFEVSHLPAGQYWLEMGNQAERSTIAIVKK